MRDIIFLSHANPEDNEFTLWLALQLAREGYPVWCDLTKLLGGEDFWLDIEKAIRERALKFIYVLSKTSNIKPGPLKELSVAENVARDHNLNDFIIPLHIDSLHAREINIQLSRLNAIAFDKGWAKGLKDLLDKLEKDEVLKNLFFTPSAVASWWREQFSANEGIVNQPEEYLSSWFPVNELPPRIYFHILYDALTGKPTLKNKLPYPGFQHNNYIVSFAKAEDFEGKLGDFLSIGDTHYFSTQDFLDGKVRESIIKRKQARDFIIRLLRMAWEGMTEERALPIHELANDTRCFYFTKGLVENDTIAFRNANNKTSYRNIVGYKTVKATTSRAESKRYWHFGIQAKPLVYPNIAYCIKPHVIFSDDGKNIWESKLRLHRARRSQCKSWWNAEWRDRILATMSWLADEEGKVQVKLGSDIALQVSSRPQIFISPVSYADPDKKHIALLEEGEEYDDDVDELGDDVYEDEE